MIHARLVSGNPSPAQREGFTLVELSIVLVIIGLLIGGILVGQSMIESAKISAQITQIQQFDIAIANFRSKFGGLPGDTLSIGCGDLGTTLCENGVVDTYGGGGWAWSNAEICRFWPQLSAMKMLVDGTTYISGSGGVNMVAGVHMPKSKLNKKTGIVAHGIASTGRNYYYFASNSSYQNPFYGPGISPNQSLAIDTKIDDSNPWTGKVFIFDNVNADNALYQASWWCVGANGKYDLSSPYGHSPDEPNCALRIDMFSQSSQ